MQNYLNLELTANSNGALLPNPGAASDILRAAILREVGGVYLDTDTSLLVEGPMKIGELDSEFGFLLANNVNGGDKAKQILVSNAILASTRKNRILDLLLLQMEKSYGAAISSFGSEDEFWNSKICDPQPIWRKPWKFRIEQTMEITGSGAYFHALKEFYEGLNLDARLKLVASSPEFQSAWLKDHRLETGPFYPAKCRVFSFPRGIFAIGSDASWMGEGFYGIPLQN